MISFNCFTFNRAKYLFSQNEPSERTHLLAGSVNNTAAVRRTDSDDFLDQYPNSLPKKDEQSALTRIVQDTAT